MEFELLMPRGEIGPAIPGRALPKMNGPSGSSGRDRPYESRAKRNGDASVDLPN